MYLHGIIILSVIHFHAFHNSSTTERITIFIYKTSRGSGIFKALAVVYGAKLWLACCHLLIGIHHRQQWLQPSLAHLDIRIQQHIEFCFYLLQSLVVAIGKTIILIQHYGLHRRAVVLYPHHRTVGRSIICHPHLGKFRRLRHNIRKILAQHLLTVPVQYYYRYSLLHNAVIL